jgi:hypothetical protein
LAPSVAPIAPATPSAAAALLSIAGGSAAVLLLLYAIALAADLAGTGMPGLVAALDPVRPGSLPELCGLAWLAVAAVVALAAGFRAGDAALLRLGLLPVVLASAEVIDLTARLEPHAGALIGAASGTPAAKFVADALVSGVVLVAAAAAAIGGAAAGRRCLLAVLLVGGAGIVCDLAGRLSGELLPLPALGRVLETVEEILELGLYSLIATEVLAAGLCLIDEASVSHRD